MTISRKLAVLIVAAATVSNCPSRASDRLPAGVFAREYTGWNPCVHLSSSDTKTRAIIAPQVGGRIVHYSLSGENIIFENPSAFGLSIASTNRNFWVGGYQCDIGPELRNLPEHRELWMGPWTWSAPRDYTVKTASPPDARMGVQLEKEFLYDPDSGDLGIVQRMKNISDREVAYCLWDRTLSRGGGFAVIPLKAQSRFKAGWSMRRTVDGRFNYDGDKPASPQVKVLSGMLVTKAVGEATKIGVDSDAGWIAYIRGKLLFIKYFPVTAGGNYSDGGNTVDLYFDLRVAELEPLSPEVKLAPGQSYEFPEKWVLIELDKEAVTFEDARRVAKKIPPSPFK